jgi:hypothetical protein
MQLALGKFTLEHFSRFNLHFKLVEVEAQEYFTWDARGRERFRKWITKKDIKVIPRLSLRTDRGEDEMHDLLLAAREVFGKHLEFLLVSSGRKRFDLSLSTRSYRSLQAVHRNAAMPLYFEWGEEDTMLTTQGALGGFPDSGAVLDPDLHRNSISKLTIPRHFKLHGWHPDRWMRRYGNELSKKIVKRVQKVNHSILILAHSGRVEEATLFYEHFRKTDSD